MHNNFIVICDCDLLELLVIRDAKNVVEMTINFQEKVASNRGVDLFKQVLEVNKLGLMDIESFDSLIKFVMDNSKH